ncbi:hypothetical protein [Nonomuraea sp. SYSU D8015]|nr:hypothetical protein [Nonomuraea sp. SYSU D8015]
MARKDETIINRQGWWGRVVDVRYSDWGMKLTIKPPPAAQTIALNKLKN